MGDADRRPRPDASPRRAWSLTMRRTGGAVVDHPAAGAAGGMGDRASPTARARPPSLPTPAEVAERARRAMQVRGGRGPTGRPRASPNCWRSAATAVSAWGGSRATATTRPIAANSRNADRAAALLAGLGRSRTTCCCGTSSASCCRRRRRTISRTTGAPGCSPSCRPTPSSIRRAPTRSTTGSATTTGAAAPRSSATATTTRSARRTSITPRRWARCWAAR